MSTDEKLPFPIPDPLWTCVRCGREFRDYPGSDDPPPFAAEIVIDKNGRRRQGGYICEPCHEKAGKRKPLTPR